MAPVPARPVARLAAERPARIAGDRRCHAAGGHPADSRIHRTRPAQPRGGLRTERVIGPAVLIRSAGPLAILGARLATAGARSRCTRWGGPPTAASIAPCLAKPPVSA